MSHVPSPFYFRNGRKRKDFRNGVLTYLWIIARNTEEIKEMLKQEKQPFDVDRFIEGFKRSTENSLNCLGGHHESESEESPKR